MKEIVVSVSLDNLETALIVGKGFENALAFEAELSYLFTFLFEL
jgi:hypothetical protein